jgi:hypothetical protein
MPLFRFALQSTFDGLPDDVPQLIDVDFISEEEANAQHVGHEDAFYSDEPPSLWTKYCPPVFKNSSGNKAGGLDVLYIGPSEEQPPLPDLSLMTQEQFYSGSEWDNHPHSEHRQPVYDKQDDHPWDQ